LADSHQACSAAKQSRAVCAEAVSRTLGSVVRQVVLQPTTIEIERGEFVALTGPSGAGKSTLLYLLGVLDRPTSGKVWIEDVDASALTDSERAQLRSERLGFVCQSHFLLPEFTVLENVEIPMLRRGMSRALARDRARTTLERLNLGSLHARRPFELSGGQQQRTSIARAVAGEPSVVFADEPTGSLDSTNGEAVMSLFEHLSEISRVTFVVVTHDGGFARRMSRQIELKDGRIVNDTR
jgi:lipoprotein-releasing system ATP-binding protein